MLCQGRIYFAVPPCFTVSRALCGIRSYSRQLTYAHTSQNTRLIAFDCALRGPFGGLFPARLSPSRTLCKGIAALISASTVCYEITRIVSIPFTGVKHVMISNTGEEHCTPVINRNRHVSIRLESLCLIHYNIRNNKTERLPAEPVPANYGSSASIQQTSRERLFRHPAQHSTEEEKE